MPSKWQRAHHHHHRISGLLAQYAHLNIEEKIEAFEQDVSALAIAVPEAWKILERIANKIKARRQAGG
jgi:hypothetical protein